MGDGKFQWFHAIGQHPEAYHGPYETREQAIAQALSEEGGECGYTIVEADKSVASNNIFDADHIFEQYEEHNEECWGEDGADMEATGDQKRELEKMLSETLAAWFEKHGTKPRPWGFGDQRSEEYFPPKVVGAD